MGVSSREEILILEDEEKIRRLLERIVTEEGYAPRSFASARDALKRLEETRPIAILADVFLPGMNGIEFLRELRKSDPNVPVIVLTGYPDQSLFREILQYQISDFLAKPFTPETVQQALRKILAGDASLAESFLETITHRLREARLTLGLKQSEVAARCGLSTSQVSQIELRQSAPSITTLLKLCKALHMNVAELVRGF